MIYIAEHESFKENEHQIKITDKTVTKQEYEEFIKNFSFYGQVHQLKEMHGICFEAYEDLSAFLTPNNLNELLRNKDLDTEIILQTANKLILNYCTAAKLLIEKIEIYLSRNIPTKSDEFKKLCSNYYDSRFEYRFFMRLRNYIIHNSMPFTKVVKSLNDDCHIYMNRKNLLKWGSWSTVKADLEAMVEDDIDIKPFLIEMSAMLYAIYLQSIYYLVPDFINSIKNINSFCEKHSVKTFNFIEYENVEDLENNNFEMHIVPWETIIKAIKEMNKHPSVNIKLNIINA